MAGSFVTAPHGLKDKDKSHAASSHCIHNETDKVECLGGHKPDSTQQPDNPRFQVTMPPSTPPRELPVGRTERPRSSCGSTTTVNNTSPGSSDDSTSSASTAPSSLVSSPVTPCPASRSERHDTTTRVRFDLPGPILATSSESSLSLTERSIASRSLPSCAGAPKPQDLSVNNSSHAGSDISHTPYNVDLLHSPLLPRSPSRFYSYPPASPTIFDQPPSLDASVLTTFGPFPSPHTLQELHALAHTSPRVHIEPCLQCQLKNLPCPITYQSPAHGAFGPLVLNSNGTVAATAPRSRLAHPRFPACLRCIRAGDADTCIVQRSATHEEKSALIDDDTTLAEDAVVETGVVLFPTDRDVLDPTLWRRKMELREALLHHDLERQAKKVFAPVRRRCVGEEWEGEVVVAVRRRREERDRRLLSGRGREEVLLPTEVWGERWLGGKEREEEAYMERLREMVLAERGRIEAEGVGAGC